MDARTVFRKILDRYDGKYKKSIEALWRKQHEAGTLEEALLAVLEHNGQGLKVHEALERWQLLAESDKLNDFFSQMDGDEGFNNELQKEINENLSERAKRFPRSFRKDSGVETLDFFPKISLMVAAIPPISL